MNELAPLALGQGASTRRISMSATMQKQLSGSLKEIRSLAGYAELHPESLLNIPIVREAFCDLGFRFVPRAIDARWTYERVLPINVSGFNPFESAYFYSHNSQFSKWLEDPFGSARDYNENDLLVREVLFMAHDYIHAWTYRVIDSLFPEKKILSSPISQDNFEDLVFCHLLTEAAATVGLDYWILSLKDANYYCNIGSNVGPLTISYREKLLDEYKKFAPNLEVQKPDFFVTLATFYCIGEFPGFGADDLRRSPQLLAWLKHELTYGVTQRKLTRSWLKFLSDDKIKLSSKRDLEKPIAVDTEFRQSVLENLSHSLWEKVQLAGLEDSKSLSEIGSAPPVSSRQAPLNRDPDFRFLNLGHVTFSEWSKSCDPSGENFSFFLYQLLASMPFGEMKMEKKRCVDLLLRERDVDLALQLLGLDPEIETYDEEPRDLFIAN